MSLRAPSGATLSLIVEPSWSHVQLLAAIARAVGASVEEIVGVEDETTGQRFAAAGLVPSQLAAGHVYRVDVRRS